MICTNFVWGYLVGVLSTIILYLAFSAHAPDPSFASVPPTIPRLTELVSSRPTGKPNIASIPTCKPNLISSVPRSFKEIADRAQDDKSFKHRFHHGYQANLEHLRGNRLDMLEIGLGCDQEKIGASVQLWQEFLPFANLTMIEYDGACVKKWLRQNQNAGPRGGFRIYVGDQADPVFLRKVLNSDGGKKYDLMIDDGGHKMHQQITSFETLYSAVKSGGIYVIEDINTSFKTRYGGSRRPNCTSSTTLNLAKRILTEVHAVPVKGHTGKYLEDVEFKSPFHRLDCFHFICFITKR